MCFSATASFSVGVALAGFSIATLKKVQTPAQYPFASIPLLFAIQQFIEGWVWLSLTNPDYFYLQRVAAYAFLFIAQVVWPVWVPFAIRRLENDPQRKKILNILIGVGAVVAFTLFYLMFAENAYAEIQEHHILYHVQVPAAFSIIGAILYFAATATPQFVSSVKHMQWFAWSALASYVVSKIYFEQYLVSVWCFFAAVISVVVFAILHQTQSASTASKSVYTPQTAQ